MSVDQSRPSRTSPSGRRSQRLTVVALAAGVVAVLAVVAVIGAAGDGGVEEAAVEVAEVSLLDDPLPAPGFPDPAVGAAAPGFAGVGFDGSPVRVEPGEEPTLLVFVAHWCPHCQADLSELSSWLATGGGAGVRVIAVSTGVEDAAPNYPPSAWFAREGWPAEVVVDDGQGSLAGAYGLTGYPFFAFLDGEGTLVARRAGAMGTDALEEALRQLRAGG